MRFLSVIKVKRTCQVIQTNLCGKNVNAEQFGGQFNYSVYRSTLYGHDIHTKSSWKPHGVSIVPIYASNAGILRGLLYGSRKLMATVSGSWRWAIVSGETLKKWETTERGMDFWTSFSQFLRPKAPRMLCQGNQSNSKAPWRPAILATLADNKGQVVMRSLGLMLGGAYVLAVGVVPEAEQFQGRMALNSLNQNGLSLGCQLAAVLCMVSTLGIANFDQPDVSTRWSQTVEKITLVWRAIYLLGLFIPCIILAPFIDYFDGKMRIYWLQLLLATLERAGPAFIKWGQWAATRPDIFAQDVCDWLAKLHMQAPSHSFEQTRKICEKAFKVPLEDIFEEFSEDPVASGSIAQVHRAVLKGQAKANSKPQYVAVKVRHPGVSRVIQRDFVIIKWLANISTVLPGVQHLQLDKTVQQFASFMTKQVDLTLEAAHLLRFIYNFRKIRNVSFPVPIYPWVHPSVLVETYEEGQSIANFVDLTTVLTPTHSQLAYIGSSALLKMLLMDNFIHGDLHPGNIFVRFTGSRPNVILLDVGMTAELNQRNRDILLELFKAVAEKDGLRVAKWTLQFSEDQSCPDPEGFQRDVDAKFKEYLIQRGTAQNTGECMTELFDQVRRHRVNMDGDVCTVMVTTLILEGWQRKLDPDLDIIQMVGDLLFKQEWAIPYDYTLRAIAAP